MALATIAQVVLLVVNCMKTTKQTKKSNGKNKYEKKSLSSSIGIDFFGYIFFSMSRLKTRHEMVIFFLSVEKNYLIWVLNNSNRIYFN